MRIVVPLVALALLAGCVGTDEPTTPAADSSEATGSVASRDVVASNATPETATVTLVDVPVSFDGALGNYAASCGPQPTGCQDTPTDGGTGPWLQETPGAPRSVQVELSWTAATPATQELGFIANACWETEEGGMTCEFVGGGSGTSPLALDVSGLQLPDNAILRLWAYLPSALPDSPVDGLWVYYEIEQAYHIEGVVTLATAP